MNAYENVFRTLDFAFDERDMRLARKDLAEANGREVSVAGGEAHDGALDQLLVPAPILDEIRDSNHLQTMPPTVVYEIGHPRHRAVVVHDLADHAGRIGPASRARSTAASVWPARCSTPPSVHEGRTCARGGQDRWRPFDGSIAV